MANSSRKRTPEPEPVAAAMGAPRYSAWQVIGLTATVLALVAVACGAGVGLGYAWGRAAGRAAQPFMPMLPSGDTPFPGVPEMPPSGGRPGTAGPAFLGITYAPLDAQQSEAAGLAPDEGARVVEVVPGGPADQAGLRADDIIVRVDGDRVRPPERLRRLIQAHQAGDTVELDILRNGRDRTVRVVLGSAP